MAKSIIGEVSSIAGDKTIVITTHWRKTHPIYKKQYKASAKYMAHDDKNDCNVGDKVVIEESRPLSARKRYVLKEILKRAELTEAEKAVFEKPEVLEVLQKPEAKSPESATITSPKTKNDKPKTNLKKVVKK